ncbi:alpha/beta hydrolase [Leifsonia shinshuensis]
MRFGFDVGAASVARVPFDDAAADSMIRVATSAASALRDQGWARRNAAEGAAADLRGGYGPLFERACGAEAEDRGQLAGVLEALAAQIAEAKALAAREQARRIALAEWQVREDQRRRERAMDPTGFIHVDRIFTDPKPTDDPVAPPSITAAFVPLERVRAVSGRSRAGTSSADPVRLRDFVTQSRAMNTRLEPEVAATRNAWVAFAGACSWARVGTATFADGFGRMLTENTSDATWIERVAAKFEEAGGGSLPNRVLNAAARLEGGDVTAEPKFKRLLDGTLSPAEAARYWDSLGLDAGDVRKLPPETLLRLASMDGLPAWAQDAASRGFLKYALKNPDKAYAMMGFSDPWAYTVYGGPIRTNQDLDIQQFTDQLMAIQDALTQAEKDARRRPEKPVVQLLGLGSHDGWLVAGISIGDLDTATNVGVNVSGMSSNVGDMVNGDEAAAELFNAASKKNPSGSYAVVNWVGYRSPTIHTVHGMERADSGGERLAGFLNGINASRQEAGGPVTQFNVYAHSYGSTVAVEALKRIDFEVDALVTYGSAGVKNGTTIDQLHTGAVYATHASRDITAPLGQLGSKGLDPLNMKGVRPFSAEASTASDGTRLKATTMHAMYQEEDTWTPFHWDGTVGYLSKESTSLNRMGYLLATGRLE